MDPLAGGIVNFGVVLFITSEVSVPASYTLELRSDVITGVSNGKVIAIAPVIAIVVLANVDADMCAAKTVISESIPISPPPEKVLSFS